MGRTLHAQIGRCVHAMNKLNSTDIQGFVLRGYTFPVSRFLFLDISKRHGQEFLSQLIDDITTGERWEEKPASTVNIAFTYKGLVNLKVPTAPLLSFPVEFVQGMKERGWILGDTGKNAPTHWDSLWVEDSVHAWLAVYARDPEELNGRCAELQRLMAITRGAAVIGSQDAGILVIDGRLSSKEHFGFSDGFSNPDYEGVDRQSQPGHGKLTITGKWEPLATGELLLGYLDEAGELPSASVPLLLAKNGTFLVYRKLHQNIATFRKYLRSQAYLYPGGEEKLAAKFAGRWRDGTPLELSPDSPDSSLVMDPHRNTNFTYGKDLSGARCPLGAHVRRANPRDACGFDGMLVNRHRISRRGIPYGPFVPEGLPVRDEDEHGMIFMALNASIGRQFEFVCQQWIEYGDDARQGSDRDPLVGNHLRNDTFMIQGSTEPRNPPFFCGGLPNFVELRGGEYFFVPSITALKMIAAGTVDPY
jgi:Dyp-type peroxidase family